MASGSLLPAWAMVDRDLRRYFRSPALITVSLFVPLLQLVIIGQSFGGQIRGISVALVTLDREGEAVRLEEKFRAVEANARTFHVRREPDLAEAVQMTRDGDVVAAIVVPEDYSRRVHQRQRPALGLIVDNTDPFVVAALTQKLHELVDAVNRPDVPARYASAVALDIVEVFPYVQYMQYLLPATIVLAVFVSALIGGGLLYIDDKARGFHEGYLATPVTKTQLVLGMMLSGTVKAAMAGAIVTAAGAAIVGIVAQLSLTAVALLLVLNVLFAFSLLSLVALLVVRVSNPVVPRATFGILNTLLFFPSGALYPVSSFPEWMQWLSSIDPFTYAVHAFRAVLLKDVGPSAIASDLVFLTLFPTVCVVTVLALFPRRL
jgi:ABC-type multidrug transport system permease subunit